MRANSKNINVKTSSDSIRFKSNGINIENDVKEINIIGGSVEKTSTSNVSITLGENYDLVTSIPSYIKPDGKSVIDNGNGTYSIIRFKNDNILLSYFGAKDDLEYFNVTTDGTSAVVLASNFNQSYVGKKIRIKHAHLNPNTPGGEVPYTTLGRIVTVSATILSVVDGVSATIDFVPNKAGAKRCYCFTNTTESFLRAVRYCQYKKLQQISADFSNRLGFDFFDKGIYASETTQGIYISLLESGIKITTLSAMFKATNEFTNGTTFFNLSAGNNDFYLDVPVLPADRFARDPQASNNNIVEIVQAGNSVRNITIKNQNFTKDDLDGNDGFWNRVVRCDSTGGSYTEAEGRKSQKLFLNNNSTRCKNGSYSLFQGIGYSQENYFKDVFLNDEQHFEGEKWREFATDSNDRPMSWQINTGSFSVINNVVTTTEEDFSFFDTQPAGISITVTINNQSAIINSITDAKTAVLSPGISDTTNQNCTIGITGRSYFNHALYASPACIIEMVRCKSRPNQEGNIKMYSDTGNVEDHIGEWRIIDCTEGLYRVETKAGGTTSTATKTTITNSKVDFFGMSGYCTVKNSTISGTFIGHSFITEGGNTYNLSSASRVNDDNQTWISIGEKGNCPLNFSGVNSYVFIQAHQLLEDNSRLPSCVNGTMVYKDILMHSNLKLGQFLSGSITNDTTLIFDNFISNGLFSYSLFNNIGFDVGVWKFRKSRFYASPDSDNNSINFDNTHQNLGAIEVIDEHNNYYMQKHIPSINKWNFYKELEFVRFNPMDSNFWIIKDFSFSLFVAVFQPLRNLNSSIPSSNSTNIGLHYRYNMLAMCKGIITVKFEGDCKTNPYQHTNGSGAFNSSLRENTTLSNMVVKSIDRQDGEIVQFLIDSKDNRLIEINSSITRRYATAIPTRLGVQDEIIFDKNNADNYWVYEIDFADDSTNSYAGTQTDVAEKDDADTTTQTNTHIDIIGTPEWSIFQEKSDGTPLINFDFSLNKLGGGVLEFEYDDVFDDVEYHPDFSKHLWQFKSSDASGYICFMNNRTGQIVFDGVITEMLDTTNVITINSGQKITRREWVLK